VLGQHGHFVSLTVSVPVCTASSSSTSLSSIPRLLMIPWNCKKPFSTRQAL